LASFRKDLLSLFKQALEESRVELRRVPVVHGDTVQRDGEPLDEVEDLVMLLNFQERGELGSQKLQQESRSESGEDIMGLGTVTHIFLLTKFFDDNSHHSRRSAITPLQECIVLLDRAFLECVLETER